MTLRTARLAPTTFTPPGKPPGGLGGGAFEQYLDNLVRVLGDDRRTLGDQASNLVLVGDTVADRPTAIGSNRIFYDLGTGVLYMDVDAGDWQEITTSGGDYNIDGGHASEVYLPSQLIDGGDANG